MHRWADCHNHTAEWSDGRQSIEQILERAEKEKVCVGVSDHAGLADFLHTDEQVLAYADYLSQYPVLRGLEMDLGRSFLLSEKTRRRLQYVIGSVHGLEIPGRGRVGFYDLILYTRGQKKDYDARSAVGDLETFFKLHLELLRSEFRKQSYTILGHPTFLPPLALGEPQEIFPEWWEDELVALLARHHVALEISNRWKTPYARLAKKALQAGVSFSLGSDGHDPKKTCVLEFPLMKMKEWDIPPDRVLSFTLSAPAKD